jgi:hypothetical protein
MQTAGANEGGKANPQLRRIVVKENQIPNCAHSRVALAQKVIESR